MQQDSVDRHIEHWQREIPELDPLVEGVITRMQMLLRHLHQTRQATLADTYGLEEHEYATLHFLGGCGPDHRATPSEIAAWHKMSPSGITGRLDALEKRGYIRRLPSPTDRRKVIVELTEEGRQAWRSTFDPQTDEETRVLAALTVEEREQLNDMLRRMMRVVDRPGLLTTPRSAESADAATERRSRFTQPLLPCGARGKAARVSAGALVSDLPILLRAIRRTTAGRSAGPPVGWLPLLQPIQQAMSGQHSGGEQPPDHTPPEQVKLAVERPGVSCSRWSSRSPRRRSSCRPGASSCRR